MRKLLPILPLLLSGFATAMPGSACPPEGIKVGYFPTGIAYHQGQGYSVDLVHELARRLSCRITQENSFPRIRVLKMVESGQIDVSPTSIATPEREHYAWILPYMQIKFMVLIQHNLASKSPRQLLDNPDIKWVKVRGFKYSPEQEDFLEQLDQRHKLDTADSEDELYKMLIKGMSNAAFAYPDSYDTHMHDPAFAAHIKVIDPFPNTPPTQVGLMLSRSRFTAQQVGLWQMEIRKMIQDRTLHTILRRHMSASAIRKVILPDPGNATPKK